MTKARDIASAIPAPSTVSSAELGHLDGVTSAIQTQLDAKTAKSTLTTTGDIYYASAANTPARLGIGSTDQVLKVTGGVPVWATPAAGGDTFTAGKNKIINGAMNIWQRGTSFTLAQGDTFTVDRLSTGMSAISSGTITASQQAFTAGAAPVAGYESQYFWRIAGSGSVTGLTYLATDSIIEDVRTFAGQTVAFSFWGKADSNRTQLIEYIQVFGTGGSSAVSTSMGNVNLTTSWQRFTLTITVPSISGKTIDTNNHIRLRIYHPQNAVFNNDFWGMQLEAGSTATAFQTATGTIQGELAACQRYFQKSFQLSTAPANNSNDPLGPVTFANQTRSGSVEPQMWIQWKTQMRSAPSVTLYNLYSGTAGQWTDGSTTGANARCFNISDSAAVIDNTDVTLSLNSAVIHYAASSEL